jgi:TonB family protein
MFASWWALALDLVSKGTVVLAAACVANVLFWRAPAAIRHTVWVLALGSLLALPMFEAVLPAWRIAPALDIPRAVSEGVTGALTSIGPVSRRTAPTTRRDGVAVAACGLWVAGALLFIRRWRAGSAQVTRMRRQASVLAQDGSLVQQVAASIGLRRSVLLLRSAEEIVPLAAGTRRPVILMPASAAGWSRERLQVVLLHEMAHIRRRDCLVQALGELTACIYWFHPLVWLALRRLRAERERACDDLVLHAGTKASDYAVHLLELARSLQPAGLTHAAVSMAAPGLETRLRAILNPKVNRRAMNPSTGWMAGLVAACLVLPLAALRPQTADSQPVTGTVYDAAGARVPGGSIIVARTDTGQELKAVTDQAGNFSIGPLPEGGVWRITVEAPGFATRSQRVDRNHFELTLDVAPIQESVVVHGRGTPAAVAGGPHRVRVGGNVIPAKLVYQVDPEYPDDARSQGIQGDVVLRAVVSRKGTVLSLTSVSSPDPQLTEAAVKAVREWRYQPSLLNGEPIETATTITVNFQLEP